MTQRTVNPFFHAAPLPGAALLPAARARPEADFSRLPEAPLTGSPVPHLTSLYHNPDPGHYGSRSYSGNCSGNLIRDLLLFYRPSSCLDPFLGSGTCRDVCKELGVAFTGLDIRYSQDACSPSSYPRKQFDFVWSHPPDRRTQVPPAGLLPGQYRRKRPYIYSDTEIEGLVRAAGRIPSAAGLKGRTLATVFGLLAVTGLRVSEALALDREDVDLQEGALQIRRTKFGKSRLVAVHESTRQALADYASQRDRVVRRPAAVAFFLSETGGRVTGGAVRYNFAKVSREVGLRAATTNCRNGRGPRLHDMRHRFVVCTLLRWYRAGVDVEREMPKLTTYLGHVHVNVTYWYVEAVPELLGLAARRLENRKGPEP